VCRVIFPSVIFRREKFLCLAVWYENVAF
jgi:hypothetical protein